MLTLKDIKDKYNGKFLNEDNTVNFDINEYNVKVDNFLYGKENGKLVIKGYLEGNQVFVKCGPIYKNIEMFDDELNDLIEKDKFFEINEVKSNSNKYFKIAKNIISKNEFNPRSEIFYIQDGGEVIYSGDYKKDINKTADLIIEKYKNKEGFFEDTINNYKLEIENKKEYGKYKNFILVANSLDDKDFYMEYRFLKDEFKKSNSNKYFKITKSERDYK